MALFAIPYFAIAILLHRFGRISTPQVFWLIAVGLILLSIALILAFKAVSDLWNKGHKGGGMTVRGILLIIVMLVPFGYYGYLALARPLLNDVATDVSNPPEFITVERQRETAFDDGINQLSSYGDEYGEIVIAAYPRVGPRRYPAGAERVYRAVKTIIDDRGWRLTATRDAPKLEVLEGEVQSEAGSNAQSSGALTGAVTLGEGEILPDILIEAETSSFVFAFKGDVVVRITSEDETTLVDMRSSVRWGRHDFGTNAERIERFMNDLDIALLGIAGEG